MCLDGWSPLGFFLCGMCRGRRVKQLDYSKQGFRAWYMDDSTDDPKLEHHRSPPKYIDAETLFKTTGVEYFKIDLNSDGKELEALLKERGAVHEGEEMFTKENKNLEEKQDKLRKFFTEHMHSEDEIRLVIDGSAYFDVRDKNDEWIRIKVLPGDMLIIPAGIYHRSTLDTNNFARARTFDKVPQWSSFNRPDGQDEECRKAYLERLEKGFKD